MLGRRSISIIEGYMAAKVILKFDWLVVHDLDWMSGMWYIAEVHSIDVNEYIRRKTARRFSSFTRRLGPPLFLGTLLLRTWRWRIATIKGHQNRLLCLGSLLLPHLCHLPWTMFMVVAWATSSKSISTTVVSLRLAFGRSLGLRSTANVTYL